MNRVVLAPVKTALGGTDGRATAAHVAYYRRRAAGGASLLILEPLYVDPAGKEHPKQLGAHDDAVIPGLRDVVAAIHAEGAAVFAHLNHAGRAANPKASGRVPEAPSAVFCPATGVTPEPMTGGRISEVVGCFAAAAGRAVDAGCDGVELQLGLGYLAAQFMSKLTNHREDEYGAAGEVRWRFAGEVVAAVRARIGAAVALTARVSADEKVEGGLGLVEARELARRLELWGVDAVHVVTGSACDSPPWYYQHMALPAGVNEELAGAVKEVLAIPVIVAGRLGDPDRMRAVLAAGMADAVALGRPLLADPDLPRKMREGREDEILACGSCLQGCLARVKGGGPIACIVNPEAGGETAAIPAAAALGERLVVVGGGPAGMTAALTAHRLGHAVTLLEQRQRLGGLFNLAPATPGKAAMQRPLDAMVRAVESAGIDVRTGVAATVETVLDLAPDRVVVATGSRPVIPAIPGLDGALTAEDVITGAGAVGHRVLILGGGLVGIEVAELLASRQRQVVVVELLEEVARDMEAVTRTMTLNRLRDLPVAIHAATRLTRIVAGEAFVTSEGAEEERTLGMFDTVVVAVGHRSHDPLSAALRHAGVEVVVVGDALNPGQILDATRTGFTAGARTAAPPPS
jgi:2,4-dienoyl-CoA reductase-like NADH-dependent reductase (Old Yellow Enzyme family)/thioredoxin reductase